TGKKVNLQQIQYIFMALLLMSSSVAGAEEHHITTYASYTGESVSNIRGGQAEGSSFLGTADVSVQLDLPSGGTWFAEVLFNHGQNPSDFIGDMQGVSNIADKGGVRLLQLWYQHRWHEKNSLTIGWHDLNSEFYVSGHASLFTNASFSIGPEITGNVPTSSWPETGLGVRFERRNEHHYYHLEVYGGNPASKSIDVTNDGLMWIAEAAHLVEDSTYKLGAWLHTADKAAPDGQVYDKDYGVYMVLDYVVDDTWGLFLQAGKTPNDRNDIANYIGLGLHVHGVFAGRGHDVLGLAVASAGFSPLYQSAHNLASAETVVEITYEIAVTDHLSVHPAYQWVQYPSGDKTLAAANVAILRLAMDI
ncbi:MAG: carbohydrate porin, partial [Ghiorsea sp.]|nr:carbohydrate porin [Ghiorsea sp.]